MLAESSLLLAQESKIAYTQQLRKDIACTVKETDRSQTVSRNFNPLSAGKVIVGFN